MLTLINKAPGPALPSTSSVFFEVVAREFFLNDLMGGQPTTCALPKEGIPEIILNVLQLILRLDTKTLHTLEQVHCCCLRSCYEVVWSRLPHEVSLVLPLGLLSLSL
jgi:hypothetical protein